MKPLTILLAFSALALAPIACDEEDPTASRPPPNPRSPWKIAYDFSTGEQKRPKYFSDLWFSDRDHGWACMDTMLFRYEDGKWGYVTDLENQFGQYNFTLDAVCAPAPNDVWAGGPMDSSYAGDLFHYNGKEWQVVTTGYPVLGVNDIFFLTSDQGWAACESRGTSHLLYYENGAWTSQYEGIAFTSLSFSSNTDGWACGHDEGRDWFVYHWDGANWNKVTIPGPKPWSYEQIDANAPNDVWLLKNYHVGVEPVSAALHYNGTAWEEVFVFPTWEWECDFLSPTYGWVSGPDENGRWVSWFYDGQKFTAYPWPWDTVNGTTIWINSETDTWAGTASADYHSYILHFTGFK